MDHLLCDEDLLDLLEVPTAEQNSLETPRELMEEESDCEGLLGQLPARCDEDHAARLQVLLTLESSQLTSEYLRRQPCFDATHRFSIVQWLHVVRLRLCGPACTNILLLRSNIYQLAFEGADHAVS